MGLEGGQSQSPFRCSIKEPKLAITTILTNPTKVTNPDPYLHNATPNLITGVVFALNSNLRVICPPKQNNFADNPLTITHLFPN